MSMTDGGSRKISGRGGGDKDKGKEEAEAYLVNMENKDIL